MYSKLALIFCAALVLCGCGGDATMMSEPPAPDEVVDDAASDGDLETLIYVEVGDGETLVKVEPNIRSTDDLKAYREQKIAEIEKILDETQEESVDKPYYPVVITMNRPVSLVEMRQMLGKYNPSMASVLRSGDTINYLPKADLIKNEDALIINSVKFVSTEGGGQLSYDTLTKENEMSKLEKQIATKEKELNGVDDYQLVRGVTSVVGGIHRDNVLPMQDDPRVFLADIGPADMYEGRVSVALWDDVYEEVEKYSK